MSCRKEVTHMPRNDSDHARTAVERPVRPRRRAYAPLLLGLLAAPALVALAAPPSWAPAHGWRKQHDPTYAGYSGRAWDRDYGVSAGRCDRAAIGAVLGGVAGGAVGAATSDDAQRAVAIVLGTVVGAAIGAEIGRRMDKTDRSCAGYALELAGPGQTVAWTNQNTGIAYQLTPTRGNEDAADGCRRFRLVATGGFGLSEGRAVACVSTDGTWSLAPEALARRR
jgi:surface antigen